MENGQASNKRARPHANGVVAKQEPVERKASQGGKVQGAPVAVEAPMQAQWASAVGEMDLIFYHCFACQRPLKPPVHKCEGGHAVCGGCHGDRCTACDPPTAYRPSRSMDAAIHAFRMPCRYAVDGCERKPVYYQVADHVLQCAFAPSFCPEHGCPVWASVPELVAHVADVHSWPVTHVSYGSPCTLTMPRRGKHLLVEKHDRRLFAVTLSASGQDTAVSVVCVRESSLPASVPGFKSKVWADVASNSELHVFMQSIVANSNHLPGEQQPVCLKVPPGFGNESEDLLLGVRIEELSVGCYFLGPASAC